MNLPRLSTILEVEPPFQGQVKLVTKSNNFYFLRYDDTLRRYILRIECGELLLDNNEDTLDDQLYMFFTKWGY